MMGGTIDQYNDNPTQAPRLLLESVVFNGNTANTAGSDVFLQGFGELIINGSGTQKPQYCDEKNSGLKSVQEVPLDAVDAYGFAVNGGSGEWVLTSGETFVSEVNSSSREK
jgi:hypothetical protein